MRNGEYGLGIDIGDGAISAAVCGADGGGAAVAEALPLGEGGGPAPAVLGVGDDGRVAPAAVDDPDAVGHLMSRVGVPAPVYAGDRPFAAAELVAGAVQWVRDRAAEREGRPDSWTVLTVPPSWNGHRRAELARALESVGVPRFSLVSGAVAATHHHVAAGDLPAEPTVAVYDLGASTLDTAVVGPTADESLAHLALPPAPHPWGGRDVDDAVLTHVRRCLETPDDDPTPRSAARALRAACVTAKEALSAETVVDVGPEVPGGPVRLPREELDEVLTAPVRASVEALAATVAGAGVPLDELDGIVLAGGGARVPLVAEVLSGGLGRPLVVGAHPALTAALGAAALAAEALRLDALGPDAAVGDEPAPVDAVPAGTALLAVDDALPGDLPATRTRRRSRTAPPARTSSARPAGRAARLKRGAVVAGAFVGLVVLPPALAGVLGADVAVTPSGQGVAEAQDPAVVDPGPVAVDSPPGPGPAPTAGDTDGDRSSGSGAGRVPAAEADDGSSSTGPVAAPPPAAPPESGSETASSATSSSPAPRSTASVAPASPDAPVRSTSSSPSSPAAAQSPTGAAVPPAQTPPRTSPAETTEPEPEPEAPPETPATQTPPTVTPEPEPPSSTPPSSTPPAGTPPAATPDVPTSVDTPPAEPPAQPEPADSAGTPDAADPAAAEL